MTFLVIHPSDPTTTFLTQIYAKIKEKTLYTANFDKAELIEQIELHDRIIMLGHGSPSGLFITGYGPNVGLTVIDESMVTALKRKKENIFIWCHADQFVKNSGLTGFCSGMFISEEGEARCYGFRGPVIKRINFSNIRFASIISDNIHEPIDILYQNLILEYESLACKNPIARFNIDRLRIQYIDYSHSNETEVQYDHSET